ncbi:MAG: methyltransferase domain-containing protein [Nocardioidaceae bacterium]|nr:methyltransferase domain-containing protein [Nocardioidaceae bacterium]NUS50605.1 methyltransferase domain-containing protein [Nocardioidaceae bacterium]
MTTETVAPIDPLVATVHGRYEDGLVSVEPTYGKREAPRVGAVRTPHFDVTPYGDRVRIEHAVPEAEVDDDLAGLLQDELFGPGWLRGADLFERVFTGVVRTLREDPLDAWEVFYRNTLRRLRAPSGVDRSTISGYAPVHAHVLDLLAPGSVLELGCCFGFLSLRIAGTGRRVLASDVSPGTVRLLGEMARRLAVPLATSVADAARVPAEDGSADTVLAVHLLEHLEPDHGAQVLAEAVRLAARRVVVAVPLEDEANETFGHQRTVTLDDLDRWGRATGCRYDVHERHGGWLVVDTG